MLSIRLLGPLRAHDDQGNDLAPPGQREQNCLAALAVMAPESLSNERLAAELYRDTETSDPRNAVQAVISRLRKALGQSAGCIETTAGGYRLVDVELDIDQAEMLLLRVLDAPATSGHMDASVAADLLAQAEQLWQGRSLEGLSGDLLDAERVRIDALRVDGQDAVFARQLEHAADSSLLSRLEVAVRDEPLRERRWELLMRALYRQGRQAEALRTFQRARELLLEHLGLEPGPALTQLEAQILAHDPELDVAVAGEQPPAQPETSLPSGMLSIVLCDVEGSVSRWEAAPTETADDIESLHQVWSRSTAAAGGHIVKSTGDGVMAVFGTAAAAIEATLLAMGEGAATGLVVRAAIHTGSLEPVGHDYRGPVINRCARLLELTNGGQILATATTIDLARPQLGGGVAVRDLGIHWLRDVSEPLTIWQVHGDGVRSDFPPLKSQGPDSLPRLRTTLLGRRDLISDVVGLVDDQQLVTLLGPGGIGKTSIAVAAAWELLGTRPVTFVDLAQVTDPASVVYRIADDLAPTDHEDVREPTFRIADRLKTSTDLVIVDNAEHVLEPVAAALDDILGHQLKGSFLVTTRQPLGLAGEHIFAVPPLAVPDNAADLEDTERSPSVQLFLERARANRPDFVLPVGLLPVVAHICRRLDGIPLAIELAAGRASLLSVEEIASRLDDQLRLLRQVKTGRQRRHQSLEAVVGWSVEQLSPQAHELFVRLSVMTGSFGIDGAERLMAHCGLDSADVLDELDELHGASLIVVEEAGGRFKMLEPIRQIAAAELSDRALELETRTAHARWIIDVLAEAHQHRDEARSAAQQAIDADGDQLQAAITWVAETGQQELIPELAYQGAWWFVTRESRIGERLLHPLVAQIDRAEDELSWAKTVLALGITTAAHPTSTVANDAVEAVAVFDEHNHPDAGLARVIAAFAQTGGIDIELPRRLLEEAERMVSSDDAWAMAVIDMASTALNNLVAQLVTPTIDAADIIVRGERAAATFRRLNEPWALGVTLGELGRLHQRLGDLDAAEGCFLESVELFSLADYHGVHYLLTELGHMATTKADHVQAERYHRQALHAADGFGHPGCVASAMAGLASAAEARNDSAEAIELYRQALELSSSVSLVEPGRTLWQQALEQLENDLH